MSNRAALVACLRVFAAAGVSSFAPGHALAQCGGETATWELVSSEGPSGRQELAMSYDSDREMIVLFGGEYFDGIWRTPTDTWEYNGTTWTRVATSGPVGRINNSMTYDSNYLRTVMYGIPVQAGGTNETWEWDGAAAKWRQRDTGGPGSVASPNALCFDPVRQLSLLPDNNILRGWNGDFWVEVDRMPDGVQGPTGDAMVVYDSARGTPVFHNNNGTGLPHGLVYSETWEYVGTKVHEVAAGIFPGGSRSSSMAFDSRRSRVVNVLWTDNDDPAEPLEVWQWDGHGWTNIQADNKPPPRYKFAMAYDAARDKIVLFGGGSGDGKTQYPETWELTFSSSAGASFTLQPDSQMLDAGKKATFSVAVSGSSPTYQWRKDGVDLSDGGAVSGAKTATLTINPALRTDTGAYDCVVNTECGTMTSCAARLFVLCRADFNGDGRLNINDFIAFQNAFKIGCP